MSNLISFAMPHVITIGMLVVISIITRFFLELIGQHWIKTFAHTATLVLLPIITFIITSVISGNIALSLGLVGALSIVRFRNPVKSPFELCVYFAVITMGITATVSKMWLIVFTGGIYGSMLLLYIIDIILKKFFNSYLFQTSFSEGNSLSTLEVTSQNALTSIDSFTSLVSKSMVNGKFEYVFASNNLSELNNILEEKILKENSIESYQLNA